MPENKQPEWLADATFYEIYPQSFQDTNADGIGDMVRMKILHIYLKKHIKGTCM